jgi:flagella basal body P-ring formation protein FlgA
MGMKFSAAVFAFSFVLLCALPAQASYPSIDSRPIVIVQPEVVVKGESILLGEIASIKAQEKEFQAVVADLKKISLGDAPPPKGRIGIPGAKILDLIRGSGIPPESIGYSIPQIVHVQRAGRVISRDDLLTEVQSSLSRDTKLDVQVRDVNWESAQVIPIGVTEYDIARLGEPSAGKIPLRVLVTVDGKPSARFMATAVVDDWREVPVLNKSLERGMLITPSDVELVRLNLFKQPPDIADHISDVLGRAVKIRMDAGDTLRKSMIDIPPLVPQGKKVQLLYDSGGLRATATGVAMDDGLKGDVIRVKNDSSRKIVKARIASEDIVEVIFQ